MRILAQKGIPLAMVARHEHICPEKTGLLIAAEEGLAAHICSTVEEAVAWLDGQDWGCSSGGARDDIEA